MHVELDRVERRGTHQPRALVRGDEDPALGLEPLDLEHARERIDEPEMRDALTRVDTHFAPTIDASRRRGNDLARPGRRLLERGHVGECRYALALPAGEVGYEHSVTEMQLRLEENPPSARRGGVARRPIEMVEDRATDGGGRAALPIAATSRHPSQARMGHLRLVATQCPTTAFGPSARRFTLLTAST